MHNNFTKKIEYQLIIFDILVILNLIVNLECYIGWVKNILDLIKYCMYSIIIINIISKDINVKKLFLFMVFSSFYLVNIIFFQADKYLLFFVLIFWMCSKICIHKLLFHTIIIMISFIVLMLAVYYLFGLNEEVNFQIDYLGNLRIRHDVGFTHPNWISFYIFYVLLLCIVFFQEKFNIYVSIFFLTISFLAYRITNARTNYYITIIAIIIMLLIKNLPKNIINKILKLQILYYIFFLTLILLSLYFTYFYNQANHIHLWLNNVFTGRLYLQKMVFENTPPKIFSNNIIFNNSTSFQLLIDNGYIFIIQRFGIICSLAIFIAYIYIIGKAFENKKIYALIALFLLFVASLANANLISLFLIPIFCYSIFNNQVIKM